MNRFGLVLIIVIALKLLTLTTLKVEVKAKGMFILKKKDDNTYECSFYNPESTNSASDIESKISMTGYSITNKNTSTSNESGVHFELTK